jgi:hypothetical protein
LFFILLQDERLGISDQGQAGHSPSPLAPRHFSFRLLADDGAFADLEKRFFRALDDETGVLDLLYSADDSAVRYNFIVDLQLRDHLLKLLALAFLRKDYKKVKDTENEHKRQYLPDQTGAAGVLKK